jgi:Mlc titration factor MtfA (ptsG expression regulator)
MLKRLFQSFRRHTLVSTRAWELAWNQLPWLTHLAGEDRHLLKALAARFVEQKQFTGVQGFVVSDPVKASIALQACLPILRLGLEHYRDFVEIVIYPDHFMVPRQITDNNGVVHESLDELAGESMDGGPIVLAWPEIDPDARAPGVNVIIHEFVHKLDLLDGEADGVPPLAPHKRIPWQKSLMDSYEAFCDALEQVEASIPEYIDPESEDADPFYAALPLDPYASTDPAEFFAVTAEVFFTLPKVLATCFPDLYREFASYFGQDPASWAEAEHPDRQAPTATISTD